MKKILLLILSCILLMSCTSSKKIGFVERRNDSTKTAQFKLFDGEDITKLKFSKGTISVTYELITEKGKLTFEIRDNDNQIMENLSELVGVYEFESDSSGYYKLVVIADNAKGSFKLKY